MKKIARGLGVLVGCITAVAVLIWLWLDRLSQPIPALDQTAQIDSRIYDQRFARAITEARERLIEIRERLAAPALSVSVAWNGSSVWSEAVGLADLDNGRPVTVDSLFPIGSISKTLTAVTALRLVERGLVDLDEDIRPSVPSFSGASSPVSLRQLLSHQAGVRHYRFAWIPPVFSETALDIEFESVEDGLSIFAQDPLLFEPDTSFQYSTFGYSLAAAYLESKTDQPFLHLVQNEVIDTASLGDTRADRVDQRSNGRVSAYHALFDNRTVLPEPKANPSYKWAGGGYLSTPEDLARFGTAILTDQLLSAETRKLMFTPRETADGELNQQHYGLGWRIGGMYYPPESDTIVPMINHGGTTLGAVSILMLMPDSGLVVAMAANSATRKGSGAITRAAASFVTTFLAHLDQHDLQLADPNARANEHPMEPAGTVRQKGVTQTDREPSEEST